MKSILLTIAFFMGFCVVSQAETIDYYRAERIVNAYYRGLLFRNPEPAGLQMHAQKIAYGGYQEAINIAASIAGSDEFRQRILPYYSAEQILNNVFREFFYAQPNGYDGEIYLPLIRSGRAMAALYGIASSANFYRTFVGF